MFTVLEDEIIRMLRANLSPAMVDTARIVNGPIAPPPDGQFPTLAVTAGGFQALPADDAAPPALRELVTESFPSSTDTVLALSRSPIEPLRAVEIELTPGGSRQLLRERDDYTVDYVNRHVRLRRAPAGTVRVQYFTPHPLHILSATRVRIGCQLDIWANDVSGNAGLDAVAAVALGAISANAAAIDGLLSPGRDVIDSGLPSLGIRETFYIFEALQLVAAAQQEATHWTAQYSVDATIVLAPKDEPIGLIRAIDATIAWDDTFAERVLITPPPLLSQPTTIVKGVGPSTAATLATLGITNVGQLAEASADGVAAINAAIPRARIIRDRAAEVVQTIVAAAPSIADIAAFRNRQLDSVAIGDLTALDISPASAATVIAALAALVAETTATLSFADLFAPPA